MQWGNSGVPMTLAGDRSKDRGDPEFLEGTAGPQGWVPVNRLS